MFVFLERMNNYASIVKCTEVVVKEVGENIREIKEMGDTELIVKKEAEDSVKEETEDIVKEEVEDFVKEEVEYIVKVEVEDLELEMEEMDKERNYKKGNVVLSLKF